MAAYIVRRLLSTVLVMVLVGVFVFLLLHIAPGDPAAIIAGNNATPAEITAIRHELGLSDPLTVQFARWFWDLLHGNFGISIFSDTPVITLIGQRLPATLSLTALTIGFAVILAVAAGVVAAWKAGGLLDGLLMGFAALGFSTPVFVVGYFLIYLFAIRLHWLPVEGYVPLREGAWPWLSHLILPAIALGLAYVALIARITRASMLEVLAEDYIRTARAKGASNSSVLFRHALKNAGVPIVTVIGIGVALLISGVVVTETVFNIPGVGRLAVDAITNRDYPIIQGVMVIFSGAYVVINLLVDLSYALIDPRVRY
ncbi:MAG TPA: ABC transporter permease [Acetobacteraceae bacterium]|jgi:peptide/nickel transport system permease protein|nr:ABC transporter permease [Acetobacteraceae bacterium]